MVRFPHGLKNPFHYRVLAQSAFIGDVMKSRIQVIFFTINFSAHVIKCLSPERLSTRMAYKAGGVIKISHRLTRFRGTGYGLTARETISEKLFSHDGRPAGSFFFHFLLQLLSQSFQFLLRSRWSHSFRRRNHHWQYDLPTSRLNYRFSGIKIVVVVIIYHVGLMLRPLRYHLSNGVIIV